jgi:hypothetical protein
VTPRRSADRRLLAVTSTRAVTAGVVAVTALLSACSQFGTEGIRLTVDDSIEIVAPADRSTIGAPIEVSWTDDEPRPDGAYVVLIDRSPMPPGEPVEWFARDDENCQVSAGCPDELWLARRGITVTDDTAVTIEVIPPREESREGGYVDLTVIRLDAEGNRDGEDAYTVQFRLEDG